MYSKVVLGNNDSTRAYRMTNCRFKITMSVIVLEEDQKKKNIYI